MVGNDDRCRYPYGYCLDRYACSRDLNGRLVAVSDSARVRCGRGMLGGATLLPSFNVSLSSMWGRILAKDGCISFLGPHAAHAQARLSMLQRERLVHRALSYRGGRSRSRGVRCWYLCLQEVRKRLVDLFQPAFSINPSGIRARSQASCL